MNKYIPLSVLGLSLFSFSAFKVINSTGITGTTGAPQESTCGSCHGGGPAGTTISITAVPAFTNNAFDPATNYTITIQISHSSLSRFGFDCEVLNASNANSGTISSPSSGAQILSGPFGRTNVTHTAPRSGTGNTSWSFEWLSPASGDATFYVGGNAVNNNGTTSGDTPASAVLTVTNVNTSTKEITKDKVSGMNIYPNPSPGFSTISYVLTDNQIVRADLLDISGKKIKTLFENAQEPGPHSTLVDLKGVEKGIYFVLLSSDGKRVSQKLISVQ